MSKTFQKYFISACWLERDIVWLSLCKNTKFVHLHFYHQLQVWKERKSDAFNLLYKLLVIYLLMVLSDSYLKL